MTQDRSTRDVNAAIQDLLDVGLLARWWCPYCRDYVLYRTLEMSEAYSRYSHGERHDSG
jgi:hypothetical protein